MCKGMKNPIMASACLNPGTFTPYIKASISHVRSQKMACWTILLDAIFRIRCRVNFINQRYIKRKYLRFAILYPSTKTALASTNYTEISKNKGGPIYFFRNTLFHFDTDLSIYRENVAFHPMVVCFTPFWNLLHRITLLYKLKENPKDKFAVK